MKDALQCVMMMWAPIVVVLLTATPAAAQTGEVQRTWDGHADLNGIWQAIGTAHWDIQDHPSSAGHPDLGAIGAVPPGQGVVVGNERATYLAYPFEIIQGDKKIMIVYGFAEASRTVHMDKENPEPAPIDSWMGRSHGLWDGDTLIVEVAEFNGEAWFDRAGNFASNTLRVVERYTPMGPNAITYEATIEDANVFTHPWTISMPLYRRLEANARVLEYKCVEYSEDLLYGHLRREPTR